MRQWAYSTAGLLWFLSLGWVPAVGWASEAPRLATESEVRRAYLEQCSRTFPSGFHRHEQASGSCRVAKAAYVSRCMKRAAKTFGVSEWLILAIKDKESSVGVNNEALGYNKNGSIDVGLMQINSQHFPLLASYGIKPEDLFEPCTNVMVGSWLLSDSIRRWGVSDGIARYHAKDPKLGASYRSEVLRIYHRYVRQAQRNVAPHAASTGPLNMRRH